MRCLFLLFFASSIYAAKPNVLFIMADDFRPEMGSYGSTALTPYLDKLAARSVQFERAYCQQAVCNPSRSSLLTGLRPDTLRLWNNGTHFRELNPDVTTLPLWFKEQGYTTRCVGKIFHNWHTAEKGDRRSWSADEFLHYANHGADTPQIQGALPPNLVKMGGGRGYPEQGITSCYDVPDEAYYDGRVAVEAVAGAEAEAERARDHRSVCAMWSETSCTWTSPFAESRAAIATAARNATLIGAADLDGALDDMPTLGAGAAWLVADHNADGVVNDGSELFGPSTDDGFGELAAQDDDKNGWIDEQDAIWSKLRLWMTDGGGQRLVAVGEAGVGALFLGRVETPFALRGADDPTGEVRGTVRQSGMYLSEQGEARLMQRIDLAV
jgi:hypothetical protein